ncbi:MAG: hypothetical protein ACT4OP_05365, partial [Actinomycetota bacterium]
SIGHQRAELLAAYGQNLMALDNLEPLRRRLDRPTTVNGTLDHPPAPLRGQRRIRMLPSSLRHEPSFEL